MLAEQKKTMKGQPSDKDTDNMCKNLSYFKNTPFIVKKDNEGKYEPD